MPEPCEARGGILRGLRYLAHELVDYKGKGGVRVSSVRSSAAVRVHQVGGCRRGQNRCLPGVETSRPAAKPTIRDRLDSLARQDAQVASALREGFGVFNQARQVRPPSASTSDTIPGRMPSPFVTAKVGGESLACCVSIDAALGACCAAFEQLSRYEAALK
jgi:hypothetical protein